MNGLCTSWSWNIWLSRIYTQQHSINLIAYIGVRRKRGRKISCGCKFNKTAIFAIRFFPPTINPLVSLFLKNCLQNQQDFKILLLPSFEFEPLVYLKYYNITYTLATLEIIIAFRAFLPLLSTWCKTWREG